MCLTASSRSAGIAILPRAAGALQGKGGEEVKLPFLHFQSFTLGHQCTH